MSAERYLARMMRVSAGLAARGIDAAVVGPSPDLVYLSGYDPMPTERATLLIVRAEGDPFMIVPELERPLAVSSPVGSAFDLLGWVDGRDPYREAAKVLEGAALIVVGDRLWSSHLLGLQIALPMAVITSASDVIGAVRSVKDPEELDSLRLAGAAADRAFEEVCGLRFEGRTERDVAADLGRLLLDHGHARVDFTIVASGPNGASPHHAPTDRTIGANEPVVLDFGGTLDAYCSDTTRTVVVGEPSPAFQEVYEVVRRAQTAACEVVRPGAMAQEIDRVARAIINDAGHADRFIHRTGHGIGLEVHEPPYIMEGNETRLRAGMTFSVEPGVYLPGAYGVRIEDIVAVTSDGVERFNRSDRALRVVA